MRTIGVSIAVPEPWGSRLQDFRVSNGDAQGSSIPTHITLVPPLEVAQDGISAVERHLAEVARTSPAYRIHLRGTGTFRPVSPVVFVNLVEGISQTEQLAHDCRRGPLALDLDYPYHPHVTVAHLLDETRLDRAFEELAGLRLRLHRRRLPPLRPRRRPRVEGHPRLRADGSRHLMPSPLARGKAAFERARSRSPLVDHLVRMQEHYGRVNAGSQAGAVTYFAFLSFFPILALAFVAVGYVARYFPDAQSNLVDALEQVFPGLIGTGKGQITAAVDPAGRRDHRHHRRRHLIYAGLGWLSGMRTALQVVFELPRERRPNFVIGKLRDLLTLAVVGTTLFVSVAVSGVVTRFSTWLLDLAGLDHDLSWTVEVVAVLVAMAATTLMFFVLFKVLARPHTPDRALWQGALLGSVAFEVLKQLSSVLLAATQRSPAFQAFGIALILLVWINYFSRIVMYAAAWAYTSRLAREARAGQTLALPDVRSPTPAAVGEPAARSGPDPRLAFGAGAATALGLVALVRRRRR